MKRIIIFAAILFSLTAFTSEAKRYHSVSTYFYTELTPYGSWIEIDYGVVVWRPTIMQVNWSPYRMGRWIWTYDGWYWDSYESFGYITYHYGRWFYDDYYGWLWYPDYEWAPAWVEWRYSDDYIGWAPLHPYATFSFSIGIHFTHTYYTPYHHWHFVGYRNFCDPYVYNYYVGPRYKYRIHSGTKYRTNYTYHNGRVQNRGVDVSYVRVRSGQDIREREIVRVNNSRELNSSNRNRDEIRSLDLSREEITRTRQSNIKVQKDGRRTSLDVSKVEVGNLKRNNTVKEQDKQRNNEKRTTEIKQNNDQQKRNPNVRINDSRNTKVKTEKEVRTNTKREEKKTNNKTFETRKDVNKNTGNRTENYRKQEKKTVEKKQNNTVIKNDRKKTVNNNTRKDVRIEKKNNEKREVVKRDNKQTDRKKNDTKKRNKR